MSSEEKTWGNPTPAVTLFFAVLVIMFWAMMLGYLKPEAALLLGVIQLMLFAPWLVGAIVILKSGDAIGGTLFLYFSAFFAGCSGAINVVGYFAQVYNWPLDPRIAGYLWLFAAVMLLPALVTYRNAGWIFWTLVLFADIGLFLFAFVVLGIGPVVTMNKVAAWFFFVVAIEGLYMAAASYAALAGVPMYFGRSLFAHTKAPSVTEISRDA